MTDQDAELRHTSKRGLTVSGGSGGRSDPELASQEVAQALAAVRQLPQTDDEGDGGWDPRRDRPRSADLEDVEPVSAQSVITKPEEQDEEGEGESTVHFPQKKRTGYFDLHPERLPAGSPTAPTNEAGDSFSADYRDSAGHSFADQEHPYDASARSTTYSEDFEPADDGSLRIAGSDVEAPAFIDVDPTPSSRYAHDQLNPIAPSSAESSSGQGKTAALIELYRERERQQQAQQQPAIPIVAPLAISPKPSRLPVRAGSLPSSAMNHPSPMMLMLQTMPHRTKSSLLHNQPFLSFQVNLGGLVLRDTCTVHPCTTYWKKRRNERLSTSSNTPTCQTTFTLVTHSSQGNSHHRCL